MTSTTDRNDLMPPQVKELEWVTPKISLMEAEDTDGNGKPYLRTQEGDTDEGPS